MKLWILKAVSPCEPPLDTSVGFVVRAETEGDARRMASERFGDDGGIVWFDPHKTTCEELRPRWLRRSHLARLLRRMNRGS